MTTTQAKTRKRCPQCNKMIEVGECAVLTDDRYVATSGATPWIGNTQAYKRGAWHLWHPECRQQLLRAREELRSACATLTHGGR